MFLYSLTDILKRTIKCKYASACAQISNEMVYFSKMLFFFLEPKLPGYVLCVYVIVIARKKKILIAPLNNPEEEISALNRILPRNEGQKFSLTAILDIASRVGECLRW